MQEIHSKGPGASSVEDELIGKWFPRIGALAVVIGAGFGFKYAVDQGWIGPRLRVMLGLLAASMLVAIGDWTRKREWAPYAHAITAGGIGLFYVTLWAAFDVYGLIPASVAFASLVGVSALGCGLALHHDSQALALLSVIGGFVSPFVTGAGAEMPQGLYLYTLAVDLTVVALGFVRSWRLTERIAFVASWVVFEAGTASTPVALLAATAIFVMFGVLPYVRYLTKRGAGLTDLAFVPANALIYYFAVFVRLTGDLEALRGPLTLALAAAFLLALLAVRARGARGTPLETSSAVLSFLFLTAWAPIELGPQMMAFGWAMEALLLLGIALATKEEGPRYASWLVLTLAAFTQISFVMLDPVAAVGEGYGRFAFLALIGGLYLTAVLEHDAHSPEMGDAAVVASSGLSLLWLSLEVYSFLSHGGAVVPRSADLQFGLSGAWALYAAALLVVGILFQAGLARWMAVLVFGVTVLKMSVHDLWLLDTFQRLVGFMGIGVLLLGCSLMYHRFKAFLSGHETQTSDRPREKGAAL